MSQKIVGLVALLKAKPGHAGELQAELLKMVAASRQEADCLRYELARLDDASATFVVQERYRDAAAVEVHNSSAHYQAFRSQVAAWLEGDPIIYKLREVDVI